MGLSASQARLLSITARLTDNEYHSQQIANAKMRLANATNEAQEEYRKALDSSMLVYNGYDESGNPVKTKFTPNVVFQYQPLKSQYALVNTANQILVNKTDAENFEGTETLVDFLDQYGLMEDYKKELAQYNVDLAKYNDDYNKYTEDLAKYNDDYKNYNEVELPRYHKYLEDYALYEESLAQEDLAELFNNNVGNISGYDGVDGSDGRYCYYHALDDEDPKCFIHLLNHLLDYNGGDLVSHTYSASCDTNGNAGDGRNFSTNVVSEGYMHNSETIREVMRKISDGINEKGSDGKYLRVCDGEEDSVSGSTALDILLSDYIYDSEKNKTNELKSLKQKVIDMYYIILNIDEFHISKDDRKKMLKSFTEGDMRKLTPEEPEKVEEPIPPTEPTPPIEPTEPVLFVDDLEKGQWYTNLWYRMNGLTKVPKIQTKEGLDKMDDYYEKYKIENSAKNKNADSYAILDSHLATSSIWLEDVLSQGIVVMQRIEADKADADDVNNWKNIIYSDASELTSEQDDDAIAKAEVKYEQAMKEIEYKDKRYQFEINKLDSEHNALQTQYESIQGEVAKNIERSYKTFNG